ncbi:DUF5682 family protein [Klebsiella grimontii]|uniref:DUF5682 family protein n=1 Tax=Klebsiella grimontii TaxID=2058152 RepID=UPI001CCCEA2E|nr:DUF5682 family protein [Klebsiella grimontii]MBZ7402263.1 hypothetical protein [Klebsiella grimontii]MDM6724905.1 DUF5682 family protein [Klebsiella grimontii]MDM7222576.1 DUF5682 family protein [Klebsiella grimontii]MDM7236769.1 DUF5682 family protein [Klebsiella grimontii]MDM7250392.1 DUF5682 family protein [Klebsiella grimontii]
MPEQPLIIGVRHHSPACARLVKERIERVCPRYVLIEGPADFNHRLDELFLPHQLPIAVYSYCQQQHGGAAGRSAWTPFAEFSPEWQALLAARATGAHIRFIDLPVWAQDDNDSDPSDARRADDHQRLLEVSGMENTDALWDHLFEDENQRAGLKQALETWFVQLRGDSGGGENSRRREAYMARWLAWAMRQNNGPVVVVCGGWHAPALATLWRNCPAQEQEPALPPPPTPDAVTGCYLTPYSEKRLDVLAGYLSGMPAPVWQRWCWQLGQRQAGEQLLKTLLARLRQHRLPASTADLAAAHLRAMALARMRGHTQPLRCDWLDALAGSLIKEALNAPLPWSYRGAIHPQTDPILLTIVDALAGADFGKLAPGTPLPPLPRDVERELARVGIAPPANLNLNRFAPDGLAKSQVLHRLAILEIPGFQQRTGSAVALSGDGEERWGVFRTMEQHAVLIESARYGASLADAARRRLEGNILSSFGIKSLAASLNQAALAGLATFSQQMLEQLAQLIAEESQFAEMGPALEVLYALWQRDDIGGMQNAVVLEITLSAALDRTLWLCESSGVADEKQFHAHLHSWQTLSHILRDLHSGSVLPGVSLSAALALLERRIHAADAAPLDRGAALGALMRLEHPAATAETALALLTRLPAQRLGEAVHGMLALARHQLACQPAFIAGFSERLARLAEEEFILALPDLRAAMAWLPPRERGALARQVLDHYHMTMLPTHALQAPVSCSPQRLIHHQLLEQQALAALRHWGGR